MQAGARRDVGFVAGAALIGLDPIGLAVQDRVDGVVQAAQIGRLDLDHVAAAGGDEILYVLIGIAPFIRHDPHVAALGGQRGLDRGKKRDLPLFRSGIGWTFDVKREPLGPLFQRGQILRDTLGIIVEDLPDGAIDIDVQTG